MEHRHNLRIEHGDAAVQRRRDHADDIAQIIERIGVADLAANHQFLRRIERALPGRGVRLARQLCHRAVPIGGVVGQQLRDQFGRQTRRVVLGGGNFGRAIGPVPVDFEPDQSSAAPALIARTRPGKELIHIVQVWQKTPRGRRVLPPDFLLRHRLNSTERAMAEQFARG